MLARLFTYSLFGIDAKPVEVEVDISPCAMPKTILVGLAEAVGFYSGSLDATPVDFSWDDVVEEHGQYPIDFFDVKGQETAKRAVTVAAGGGHHLKMIGSPGTGEPEDIVESSSRRPYRTCVAIT